MAAHLACVVTHVRTRAEAELPLVVAPPTFDRSVVKNDAGMGESSVNVDGCAPLCQRCKGQSLAHVAGVVSCSIGGRMAELSVTVETPALHGAVVQDGASVVVASSNSDGRPTGSKVNSGQVVAHLARVVAHLRGVTDAQLTVVIVSPALHRSGVKQSTREPDSCRNVHGCSTTAEVNRRQIITHVVKVCSNRRRASNTKLTVQVSPPTFDRSVIQNCTGVSVILLVRR